MPDISLIIPVYNVEDYLAACLDSVDGQIFSGALETILVDDGSTDSSGAVCDSWVRERPLAKVVHKENGGLVSAWTEGLANASAEWVVFLDGDDWIEPCHLQALWECRRRHDADVVIVTMKQVLPNGESHKLEWAAGAKCYRGDSLREELHPIMLNAGGFEVRGVPVSRCGKLIRKDLIVANLKYSDKGVTYEEDMNIMFPTLLDAESICLIDADDAAYCYRMVDDSMLHGHDGNMRHSIELVFPKLRLACIEKEAEGFDRQIMTELITANIRLVANELKNPDGIGAIRRNLEIISNNDDLHEAIEAVGFASFPFKFRVLGRILARYGWLEKNVMLPLLVAARRFAR